MLPKDINIKLFDQLLELDSIDSLDNNNFESIVGASINHESK